MVASLKNCGDIALPSRCLLFQISGRRPVAAFQFVQLLLVSGMWVIADELQCWELKPESAQFILNKQHNDLIKHDRKIRNGSTTWTVFHLIA